MHPQPIGSQPNGVKGPILIVDDSIEYARTMEELIVGWGVQNQIHFFVDGSMVMQYLTVSMTVGSWMSPLPALIMLDAHLPTVSGPEVMQWMHSSKLDHIPIVAMTGDPKSRIVSKMLKLGVKHFMPKPHKQEDLDKLKELLGVKAPAATV